MKQYTHISLSERIQIEKLQGGSSIREIALAIGRSPSTVSREIRRNSRRRCEPIDYPAPPLFGTALRVSSGLCGYEAEYAMLRSARRAEGSHQPRKLRNPRLVGEVVSRLRGGVSPELISGRLKIDYPDDAGMWISHESIYMMVYSPPLRPLGLCEYLTRGHKKRRKRNGRRVRRSHIPQRVSISRRPAAANARAEFGHFEGDSVEGLRSVGDGIHTEVERVSRLILATKVARIDSEEGARAQIRLFSQVPAAARKSTTLDNGRENHRHFELHSLGMDTYFADPYSSFQRGTNERANGMIRRYLPKKTDFRTVSEEDLQDIVWEINNRPMKCLGFLTPQEVYNMEVEKLTLSVALQT